MIRIICNRTDLPLGRSTMLSSEIIVPAMGVRASLWRVQVVRSVDCNGQ